MTKYLQQYLLQVRQSRYYALQPHKSADTVNADNRHDDILLCQPLPPLASRELLSVIGEFILYTVTWIGVNVLCNTHDTGSMSGAKKGVLHIQNVKPVAE